MQGVKDYLNEWLLTEKSTVNNGNKAVSLFVSFLGDSQNMPLDMVTPQHAKDFMSQELKRVRSRSVESYLTYLRTAFQKAVDSRLIPFNPFHKVNPGKLDRADKQERRAFTMEEAKTPDGSSTGGMAGYGAGMPLYRRAAAGGRCNPDLGPNRHETGHNRYDLPEDAPQDGKAYYSAFGGRSETPSRLPDK